MKNYNKSLLLVDDEEIVILIMKEFYQQVGYRVTTETDSIKALDLFYEDPAKFDMAILDYIMPEITGLDLAEKILNVRCDMPVIMFTGFMGRSLKSRAYSLGVRRIVKKPVIGSQLVEIVDNILDDSDTANQACA